MLFGAGVGAREHGEPTPQAKGNAQVLTKGDSGKSLSDAVNSVLQDNTAQIAYWNDKAAVTRTAFQERTDSLTAVALETAARAFAERVIDIGCGCGATVLELAGRVGLGRHCRCRYRPGACERIGRKAWRKPM
jgi:methylase of polypeptide subunit release factors